MAIIDSDSAILLVGAVEVYRGVEYANISGTGNTLIPSEDIGVSINHSVMIQIPKGQPLLIAATFVYMFDKDSSLAIANFVVPDFYVTNVEYNANTIGLDADVESVSVVQVSDPKEITKGEISCLAYILNDNGNKTVDIIIRIYGNTLGLIHTTNPVTVLQGSLGTNVLANYEVGGTSIPAGENVYFTVEASEGDTAIDKVAILGSDTPSQIRMVRKNLW